jgi:hypothetical protein
MIQVSVSDLDLSGTANVDIFPIWSHCRGPGEEYLLHLWEVMKNVSESHHTTFSLSIRALFSAAFTCPFTST